jgi:hypothetical protein
MKTQNEFKFKLNFFHKLNNSLRINKKNNNNYISEYFEQNTAKIKSTTKLKEKPNESIKYK